MNRILIASDRPLIRAQLRTTCTDNGYCICGEAVTLERAVLYSELFIPDAVILGFRSPMRALTLAISQMAKLGKQVKILIYSSPFSASTTRAYLRAGAVGIISEKSTTDELPAILRGLIAGYTIVPINTFPRTRIKVAHRPDGPHTRLFPSEATDKRRPPSPVPAKAERGSGNIAIDPV